MVGPHAQTTTLTAATRPSGMAWERPCVDRSGDIYRSAGDSQVKTTAIVVYDAELLPDIESN